MSEEILNEIYRYLETNNLTYAAETLKKELGKV
jgi:hypothetical protein